MCREVNSDDIYATEKGFYVLEIRPARIEIRVNFNTLDICKYISFDLCEAYNKTGEFQKCIFPWVDNQRSTLFRFS